MRERFFTPRLRFRSYDELNAWLLDKTIAYARAHRHPEFRDRTIWEVFEAERPSLVPYTGAFDGFHAVTASVSKTCLMRFDNNRYSIAAHAVGRPVEIRAYADRIELRQDGLVVGEHARSFGRDQTIYDPWHYVPVLARKPGAWRNGAPFKDWVLPVSIEKIRRRLRSADDGDRQMVSILTAVLSDGLPAVDAGIRLGEQVSKDMIAVRVGPDLRTVVVGSPDYLDAHGLPEVPQDLVRHRCVNMRLPSAGGLYAWEFSKDGCPVNVRVQGPLILNDERVAVSAALEGLGLAFVMQDRVAEEVTKGRLRYVLEDWCPSMPGYQLYYPDRRHPSSAFTALLDELRLRPARGG